MSQWWAQFDEMYEPELAEAWRMPDLRLEIMSAAGQRGPCTYRLASYLKAAGADPASLDRALKEGPPGEWLDPDMDAHHFVRILAGDPDSHKPSRQDSLFQAQLAHLGRAFTFTAFDLMGPPAYHESSPSMVLDMVLYTLAPWAGVSELEAAGARILSDRLFAAAFLGKREPLQSRMKRSEQQDAAYRVLAGDAVEGTSPLIDAARTRKAIQDGAVPAQENGLAPAVAAAMTSDAALLRRAVAVVVRAFSRELRKAEERSRDGPAAAFVAARNQTHPHTQWMITPAIWAAGQNAATRADALKVVRQLVDGAETWDERSPLMQAERRLTDDPARLATLVRAHVAYRKYLRYEERFQEVVAPRLGASAVGLRVLVY